MTGHEIATLPGDTLIPFRLNCPNCQSKIVVKFSHLLGQTLPCPKCQQPIAVPNQSPERAESSTPPPKDNPLQQPLAPTFDSTAMTKEDYGDWDEVLANIPQPSMDEYAAQIDWNGNSQETSSTEPAQSAQPLFQPLHESQGLPAARAATNWQSKELAKRRQVLLIATIGILSSILAGAGFVGFLQYMNTSSPKIAKEDIATPAKDGAKLPNEPTQPPKNPSPEKESTPAVEDTSKEPSPPPETPESSKPSADTGPMSDPIKDPKPESNNTPLPNNVAPRDPLANATTPSTTPDWNQKGGSDAPDTNLDDKLNELFGDSRIGKILKPDLLPQESFGKQLSLNELDIEKLDEPPTQIFHPMPKSLPSWNERADGIRISRLAMKETSLPRCIELFSRLTGVGITIDWEQCYAHGIDIEQKVAFDIQDKTVGSLLAEVLTPLRLRVEVDTAGFPIVRAISDQVPGAQPETEVWNLAELGIASNATAFAENLIALWELNAFADAADGKITWKDNASAKDRANVWSTLSHLRTIQKQPQPTWPGSSTEPRVLFAPESWKGGRAFFERKVPLTFAAGEPRSVSEILQQATLETQSNLVIDWKNAWQHGLTPSQFAVSVLRNRTVPQVSERFLNDYALELVPLNATTVWMTTSEVRRQRFCILPVQISPEQSLDETKRALRTLAPTEPDGRSKFKFSPVAGTKDLYLVRVCLPKLQQVIEPDLEFGFQW